MYYKKYDFGDVTLHFAEVSAGGKRTTAGMILTPRGMTLDPKGLSCGAMVQAAFSGDEPHLSRSAGGIASRAFRALKITRQVLFVNGDLNTYLTGEDGDEFIHRLKFERSTGVFTVSVRYDNRSKEPRTLEWLSSFSFGGFSLLGTPSGGTLHRIRGAERVFRLESEPLSRLGLYREGAAEEWGGIGGAPSRRFYPFAALETESGYVLGVQTEAPFSWRNELLFSGGDLVFSGGISDFETGHFRKKIFPGESFETPRASFTLQRSLSAACQALVKDLERRLPVPKCEEDLPVLFLDGTAKKSSASPARIGRILKTLTELSVGVYFLGAAARKYFPDGFAPATVKIGGAGLRAGILYDGAADFPDAPEEMCLKRGGAVISVRGKRFPDLKKEEYQKLLFGAVSEVKEGGFEYVGAECCQDLGVGCDSPDGAALGEGGRRAATDGVRYLEQFTKCAALALFSPLGEKIEPYRAGKIDLCALSFDRFLPLAAANLTRVLSARRLLIPVPLEKDETDAEIEFSLCAAFLGRICLSGELHLFPPEKIALIGKGLEFYREICEIVKSGEIKLIDCDVCDGPNAKGRQIVVKDFEKWRLIVVHFYGFEGALRVPLEGYSVRSSFGSLAFGVRSDVLRIAAEGDRACAFLLEKD